MTHKIKRLLNRLFLRLLLKMSCAVASLMPDSHKEGRFRDALKLGTTQRIKSDKNREKFTERLISCLIMVKTCRAKYSVTLNKTERKILRENLKSQAYAALQDEFDSDFLGICLKPTCKKCKV